MKRREKRPAVRPRMGGTTAMDATEHFHKYKLQHSVHAEKKPDFEEKIVVFTADF